MRFLIFPYRDMEMEAERSINKDGVSHSKFRNVTYKKTAISIPTVIRTSLQRVK
jgi:hypothetical protein